METCIDRFSVPFNLLNHDIDGSSEDCTSERLSYQWVSLREKRVWDFKDVVPDIEYQIILFGDLFGKRLEHVCAEGRARSCSYLITIDADAVLIVRFIHLIDIICCISCHMMLMKLSMSTIIIFIALSIFKNLSSELLQSLLDAFTSRRYITIGL